MSNVTGTSSKSTKQGQAGSRLAFLSDYNPKMLLQKETYTNGLKGGALTFFGIISILALYMMIAIVSIMNAIHFIRTRTTPKGDSPTPLGDLEPEPKPAQEVGLNMDDVQEIPGEIEFAAMKEVMPADDQIPDIDEPQDEREHAVLSDDDSTLVGQDEAVGVKGSPVVVPSVPTIKEAFERPISPPATPPTPAARPESPTIEVVEVLQTNPKVEEPVVEIVPDSAPVEQEPPKADATTNSVEAAVKAVEEHAKIVQDATSPTDSVGVSPRPADSPISEFVFVPSEAPAKPVEEVVVPPVEAVVVPPVEAAIVPPVEVSTSETKEAVEPVVVEPTPAPAPVEEVAAPEVVPAKAESEPEAPTSLMNEPEPQVVAALVEEPESVEEPKPIEEPKLVEEPKAVEEPKVVESKVVEEPKAVEPKPVEAPKSVAAPIPTPVRKSSQDSHRSSQDSHAPKSLGRPRVMRKATVGASAVSGVTSTIAGVTPAAVSVSAPVVDKPASRESAMRRADDALNKLASSLLRSNTADRLPRSESPKPSAIPRAIPSRSSSPVTVPRSESPSSDAAGSRPASPAPGMSRRGSVALANALRPTVSRSSTLANVTNAPERKFTNPPRGGSVSPPPLPAPPQRRGSQDTPQRQGSQGSVRGSPQVPQAAVMSPSVLSRKATIDANGSPGSPPRPTRPPAEEFTTSRRNVPFPSAPDGGNQPVAGAVRPKPRPRTSTTGGTNTSLLATLGAKVTFPSNTSATPARSDSIASAVSNRDSILSVSDMSDMDASTPLDFPSREGIRMGLGRFDSCGSMSSDGMSGDDEEKRKRRAKRRSKARAQSLKKQKRSKRN